MDTVTHLLTKFQSRLATAIDADDTSIVLESVTDIPTAPFMAILDDSKSTAECVWVTVVTVVTKTLTVTRAQRGTTGVAHVAGTLLYHSEIALADLGFFETWETAGETGRPFESQLITDVLLGGWANGLKGYVDCNDTGGSIGLLSGINGEIRLPNSAARGAYFALEGEVVFQASSTITPWGSCAGFLYLGISGDGIADFDDDGRFMVITGPTPLATHLLSADSQTLKSTLVLAGAYTDRYLVLSQTGNIVHTNVAAVAANGRIARFLGSIATPAIPDGQGLFEIQASLTGEATGALAVTSTWLNVGDAASIACVGNYIGLHNDGIWEAVGATITDTNIYMQKYQAILGDSDFASMTIWNLNFTQTITALIEANDPAKALGYVAGSPSDSAIGTIPFFCTGLGAVKYIYIYPNAA